MEDPDGPQPPVEGVVTQVSPVLITTQPPSPAKVEEPLPPQDSTSGDLQRKVSVLQQALEEAEQQRELINSEYRRLLAEKEVLVLGWLLPEYTPPLPSQVARRMGLPPGGAPN